MDRPKVVLDSCVIFPFYLRDFLLRLALIAEDWVYQPYWSERILKEVLINLTQKKPHIPAAGFEKTIELMNKYFPDSSIDFEPYLPIARQIKIPDENDYHVLAAAIAVKAEVILTFNIDDFPSASLASQDIIPMKPGDFIAELMISHRAEIEGTLHQMAHTYLNPKLSVADLVLHLNNSGLRLSF